MESLSLVQLALIGAVFAWASFVRAAFSFGGALLSLPLLLVIKNEPLLFVPIIATHLLFFSLWILLFEQPFKQFKTSADWQALCGTLKWMIIPKLLGIAGLVLLPAKWMGLVVLLLCFVFGLNYLFQFRVRWESVWLDRFMLMLAGYTGGAALLGSPLIVAVMMKRVSRERLRNTLFLLWLCLVAIKFVALLLAQVDMQWSSQWWLLPCAIGGHVLGSKVHRRLLNLPEQRTQQFLGLILLGIVLLYGYQLSVDFGFAHSSK